jgi:hypothetical protein
VLQKEGHLGEATGMRRDVLAALRGSLPDGDVPIGIAMIHLGGVLGAAAPGDEAEAMFTGGFDILERQASTPPKVRKDALDTIVAYYEKAGRKALADTWRAKYDAASGAAAR